MYVKRQEQFDAIQFTGGEESAKQVIEFVREKDGLFGTYERVVNANDTKEVLRLGRKEVRESDWVVFGYVWNRLDLFNTTEFERIFQPEDKGRTAESVTVNVYASDNAALRFTETGIEESNAEEVLRDEAVITNGVIDSVPGADYIIDQTKYNEDTLTKVRDALNASEFVKGGYSVEVINQLQNAGILFRERI